MTVSTLREREEYDIPLVPSWEYVREETRGALRDLVVCLRLQSQIRRVLPDFLIVGAQRGGTTSLYHYLAGHPQVLPPFGKELQFFTVHWRRGVGWYRSHFPLRREFEKGDSRRQTFEASPYYLSHPLACRRAKDVVPEARIVALLRNPVDRAYSHYLHNTRLGFEKLSFEEAIDAEPRRLAGEHERILADPGYRAIRHRRYSYVGRGMYQPQVEAWRATYPDRLLIVRSEDLYEDPQSTFGSIQAFLGLEMWNPTDFHQYNKGKGSESVTPELRARLLDVFAEPNRRLENSLGRKFHWDG